jgi:hypothetical protein
MAAHNGRVTISANDVEAGDQAQILKEGVCFFRYERFLPLVRTYTGVKALTLEITPDGIQIGNMNISRGFWEISLFGNPETAPLKLLHRARRPRREKRTVEAKEAKKATTRDANFVIIAIDAFERRLAKQVEDEEVQANEVIYAHNVKGCDICKCASTEMCLFVDGKIRDKSVWGNMCATCFYQYGEGLGWGVGQLYALQANERWRLLRGFPPNNPRLDTSPL